MSRTQLSWSKRLTADIALVTVHWTTQSLAHIRVSFRISDRGNKSACHPNASNCKGLMWKPCQLRRQLLGLAPAILGIIVSIRHLPELALSCLRMGFGINHKL
ncbi:hypothetical protein BDV34DRAFT_3270 [Aspergillus parasiticus]|uniref:Uncharacterized protein n=1 Tax=Aspergillus parasiticus TaxID=5067 RepID=A0A5N6E694_ASPPA|nr:hypothetical protein BDV34DRAFT_3270 [Aspergillus parasiticus]